MLQWTVVRYHNTHAFVSSDLPDELERVIYLDCDIIIAQSISRAMESRHAR